MSLSDYIIREAFSQQFEKNFSIIAPAGVGKTHAIVERVVNIIKKHSTKIETNPTRLLVVTYTKKAAQEMAERVRLTLEKHAASLEQIQVLDNHFFGTIHSFCYELVCEHRLQLGLPNELSLCEDDRPYWLQFVRSAHYVDFIGRHPQFNSLLRYVSIFDMYSLLDDSWQLLKRDAAAKHTTSAMPELDFDLILNYVPENKRVEKGQEREKQKLREWMERLNSHFPLEIPNATAGGDVFKETWLMLFKPLRDWIGEQMVELTACIVKGFRNYRLQQGLVTYHDMITLTEELLRNASVLQKLRERNYAVILDEAQDCDRTQFSILLNLASSAKGEGLWPFDALGSEPAAGRFCMVGDPQQSIYSDRADLKTYQQIHQAFSKSHNGVAGEFHVTFRCDRSVIDFTNATFPNVLKTKHAEISQAQYVTMEARPDAGLGQVVRLPVSRMDESDDELTLPELERIEAEQLVQWLKQATSEVLRIRDWSECAILAPRNEWLKPLAKALEQANVPYQVRSKQRCMGDSPAYAWFAALIAIMVEPANVFEINSVLREIFGLKDSEIAHYVADVRRCSSNTHTHPLQIVDPELILLLDTVVGQTLLQLSTIRAQMMTLGLRAGVDYMVSQTRLRQRLRVVQSYYSDNFELKLARLFALASQFEKETKTILDLAEHLQKNYTQATEEEKIAAGKIQLLTCHSAKGLQWDAVIVPFLFRSISFKDLPYPRLVWPKESALEPILALDAQHVFPNHSAAIHRMQVQELERLLYVAVTRAKHSLIFLDDRDLFKTNESSFGDLLQVLPNQANATYFSSLPDQITADAITLANFKPFSGVASGASRVITLSQETYQCALANAQSFPLRVTPSALSHANIKVDREDDVDEEENVLTALPERIPAKKVPSSAGADYGSWWHETLEHAPLNSDVSMLHDYLAESLSVSPDPGRAKHEFKLLLSSDLRTRLSQPNTYLRAELPILGKHNPNTIYEGFVDLLAYLPQENTWLIIDWKTDQVRGENPLADLAKMYSAQLLAYTAVLTPLLKGKIETLLYSTRLGQVINCPGLDVSKNS